jgi:hypothetical protein
MEDQGLTNRLTLWLYAIEQVKISLSIQKKLKDAITSDHKDKLRQSLSPNNQNKEEIIEIIKRSLSDSSNLHNFFNSFYSPDNNYETIRDICISWAIVCFCQILTRGYEDKDKNKVKKNTIFKRNKNGKLQEEIINIMFEGEDESEKEKFRELLYELIEVRDKMLAHADGEAFEFRKIDSRVIFRSYSSSHSNIDIDYWQKCLEPMKEAINKYLGLAE